MISERRIKITWKDPSYSDRSAARELIERVHYQNGRIGGEFVIGFADIDEVKAIRSGFTPTWTSGDLCLVGAAVVKPGITYAKPKGRRDLAEKRFSGLNIDRLSRDEVVRRMGLALISRVAVEPELHGLGIGRKLAMECRKRASQLVPNSEYIEVMTSQRLHDAQRLLSKEGSRSDFLQAAGFRLVPIFTKIQRARRDGRDRRLYYWASVVS